MATEEKTEKKTEKAPEITPEEYYNEKVPLTIPITRDDQDDVFISVNERTFQIKRGVQVMVPRSVKLAWEESERQTMNAIARQARLAK